MGVPYAQQLADKQARVRALLDPVTGPDTDPDTAPFHGTELWDPPAASAESGFRNKAKMVVTGTAGHPRLGILDPRQHPKHHDGTGVDLRDCGLYEPGIGIALPIIAETIAAARLTPYDVGARSGELKHVIVTVSPDAELMLRFVLRSTEQLPALRAALPELRQRLAAAGVPARVLTANLLPEHRALPEGPEEIHLAGDDTLTMRVNGLPLHLRPQGFFQTNTDIAARLYAQASTWLDTTDALSVWDLYCGVGGFGLQLSEIRHDDGPHRAGTARTVWGLETSADAVTAATASATALGVQGRVRFAVGDAPSMQSVPRSVPTTVPAELPSDVPTEVPDAVVVNPPRRGIGPALADWLEVSGVPHLLYSSCNATTLARDLEHLPSYRPVRARLLDMFPQTGHYEVLLLLERAPRC